VLSHSRLSLLAGAVVLSVTAVGAYAAGAAYVDSRQATRTVLAQGDRPPPASGADTRAVTRDYPRPHPARAPPSPRNQIAYIQRGP
jgi:hypothetical protein